MAALGEANAPPAAAPEEEETPRFSVGELVEVKPRTFPGMNKPGGTATIRKIHDEREKDGGPMKDGSVKRTTGFTYAVKYVLNGSEKRQLAEGSKAAEKLKEKLTYGQVEEDVIVQCNRLVASVLQRDYATASAVQVALVNSHWAAHKDWLKGVKFLCQLAQKKMQ